MIFFQILDPLRCHISPACACRLSIVCKLLYGILNHDITQKFKSITYEFCHECFRKNESKILFCDACRFDMNGFRFGILTHGEFEHIYRMKNNGYLPKKRVLKKIYKRYKSCGSHSVFISSPAGFEPARALPNGFQVHLLNLSDIVTHITINNKN